jgi:S1-C subfamily serine protease
MTDFQPPRQPGPPIAGTPTTPANPTPATPPTFDAPRPPAPPTHRTRDRKAGRFAVGVALGALVGASVAGGIVAVADHGNDAAPAPATATVTPVAETTNAIAALVKKAQPSVVSIHDDVTQTDQFGQTQSGQAAGSGFVLTADGYIVTNNHVIDGATNITVDFHDGTTVDAKVVAADPRSDLAVLKVDRTGLTPLPLGSSADLQVGDQLVAIGNALDLSGGPTVTTGIVSATGRSLDEENGVALSDMIQTDTAINPGNSGGPLLNMAGQVVGINTAVAGEAQNIGFAISIDHAKSLIEQLQQGDVPAHAMLGVATQPTQDGKGVEIAQVDSGSAAGKAGLEQGDVITSVDGTATDDPDTLGAVIADHKPGDQVKVTYTRDGASHDVTVTLGARPTGN